LKRRIALWVLAIAATGVAALWLFRPEETRLVIFMVWSLVSANRHPPQIAEGLVADDDWRDRSSVSLKFTARLQQTFPVGTIESVLTSQLAGEGFKSLSEPALSKVDCQPRIQIEPIGTISETCTYTYPGKVLLYYWGGPICSRSLSVSWSTDAGGKITRIAGQYYGTCL